MSVKVRERPKGSGVWWIFIDHQGKRKSKKIGKNKRLAKEAAEKIEAKLTLGDLNLLEEPKESVLFKDYSDLWLEGYVKAALKRSTYRGYRTILNRHLLPEFGNLPLSEIRRDHAKSFLLSKLNSGLAPGRVKHIKSALSGMLTQAMEDGHVETNPVSRLGKIFSSKDQNLGREYSPYTAQEMDLYLETCREHFPASYPMILTLARTGARLGEILGLQWGDIDFAGNFIEIRRAIVNGRLTTPKSGRTRRVDMTPMLAETLLDFRHQGKEEAVRNGWGQLPEWVFHNKAGNSLDPGNLRARVHYKACEKAGLRRVRIHDLRHSYATIRITAGHNIADVSRQLGHSSIKITVDTYYHWIPNQAANEVSELDTLGKNTSIRNLSATTNKNGLRQAP